MCDAGEEAKFRLFHALVLKRLVESDACFASLVENLVDVVADDGNQSQIDEEHPPSGVPRMRDSDADGALGIEVGLVLEVGSYAEFVGAPRQGGIVSLRVLGRGGVPVVFIAFQLVVVLDAVRDGEFGHTEGNHEGVLATRQTGTRGCVDGCIEHVFHAVFEFRVHIAHAETREADGFDVLRERKDFLGVEEDDAIVTTETDGAVGQLDGGSAMELANVESVEGMEACELIGREVEATQSLVGREPQAVLLQFECLDFIVFQHIGLLVLHEFSLLLVVDEKSVVRTKVDLLTFLYARRRGNNNVVNERELLVLGGLRVIDIVLHGIVNPQFAILVEEQLIHPDNVVYFVSGVWGDGTLGKVDAEHAVTVSAGIEDVVAGIVGESHEAHFAIRLQEGRSDEASTLQALQAATPTATPQGVVLIDGEGLNEQGIESFGDFLHFVRLCGDNAKNAASIGRNPQDSIC